MVTNVLEYLERSAQRFPDKIVFGDTDREVTYRQLLDLARRAGSFLASRHLRNQPIAVISTHSTECLIVFLVSYTVEISMSPWMRNSHERVWKRFWRLPNLGW